MLDRLVTGMRHDAGIVDDTDFGCVHAGRIGYADCDVRLGIETWRGAWYLRLAVTHARGRSFRKLHVVKWPYSRRSGADLAAVVADFDILRAFPPAVGLTDQRGLAGRVLDGLIGRRHFGSFPLRSVIETERSVEVVAELNDFRGEREVLLVEHRPSGQPIQAQVPHEAVATIRERLAAHMRGG